MISQVSHILWGSSFRTGYIVNRSDVTKIVFSFSFEVKRMFFDSTLKC